MADHDLSDYERTTFTYEGKSRDVFRKGSGPAVVVMAEIPGITPKVIEFADRVADIGCTPVVPHLFGVPGRDPSVAARGRAGNVAYAMSSLVPACISKEFTVLATGRSSPVVRWLRALAAAEHERCGGPGVGAIGMCFTGGFALAMAADDRLLAPVLSQPSLPFAVGRSRVNGIDISPEELAAVKQRCARGDLEVLGLRFSSDRLVPSGRFRYLEEQLGDAFVAIELDDEAANPDADLSPHSVVTEHLIDEPGQPTREALDRVLEHFRSRLVTVGAG
jgi:dienelactone hydrolase